MSLILKHLWKIVLLVPTVFLLPMLGDFIFQRGAEYSDLVISHLPNALWIQHSLREWGQVPLWSNTILSGYPFSANPLSGLHYPPGWIALLFPQPFGINLVMLLHLLLGGAGMFLFLRSEGLDRLPAIFGALAFEALPKMFAHLGAGHVSLVYAVSWTPWLLLAENRSQGRVWIPAVVLGLIALADPRWAILTGLLWLVFALKNLYSKKDEVGYRNVGRLFVRLVGGGLLAVFLAAVLLFPLAEYTRLSTRIGMTAEDNLAYSLPPEQLLGILAPPMGGTPEYTLYSGGMILALALLGLGLPFIRKRTGFWLAVALASMIIALGSNLPGIELFARLPGINLLRVPTRALFAGGLALAVSASWTLNSLLDNPESIRRSPRFNPLLLITGLVALTLTFAGLGWWFSGEFPLRFAWGGLALAGALILLLLLRVGRLDDFRFGLLCTVWICLDLCGSNYLGLDQRPTSQVLAQGSGVADFLKDQEGLFRIYSPSYSLPQQTAARYSFELADGVDPLQLRSYAEYMRSATGVYSSTYSVTLPAFKNGDPKTDNRFARPDAHLLGLLNVTQVAAEFPLDVEGLEKIGRSGTTIVYRNNFAYPRAWVQPPNTQLGLGEYVPAKVTWSPNFIVVEANGPGRLILSEIAYPGWRVHVDGVPATFETAIIFRAVDIPSGRHIVELDYRPISFFVGAVISCVGWLAILVLWLRDKRRLA